MCPLPVHVSYQCMILASQMLIIIKIKTKFNLHLKANTIINEAEDAYKKT